MTTARATLLAAQAHASPTWRLPLGRTLLAVGLLGPIFTTAAFAADVPPGTQTPAATNPTEPSFDRSMLSGAGRDTADLARYEHANVVLPGTYNTDIYVNGNWSRRSDVRFIAAPGQGSAMPCIDATLFEQLGLHPARPPADRTTPDDAAACIDLPSVLPGASVRFNQSDLRLDIGVPQAWLGRPARGYVSPEHWDAGVPAALLNYNFNTYHNASPGSSQTSTYLGLNAGLNLGPWHLRQNASLNLQSGTGGSHRHWQNIASYVQRDLPGLRAQLTLGDSFTSGELFDSVGVRGVQLTTDDRMLPESQRGYAPTIRGVAASNAKISVSQNGIVIYQTTVAPGPFVISDLFPTGYGGDLTVNVTEADGRVRTFSVPYASVAQLLRPGVTRFALAAGQVRGPGLTHAPRLAQGTLQHGFSNLLTGYTGAVGVDGYMAALLGSALNTRYGALALDVTAARTRIPGLSTQEGESIRLSYSKILPYTDTALTVAAYRYSTSGYLGLDDALQARDYAARGLPVFATGPAAGVRGPAVAIPGVLDDAAQQALGDGDPRASGGLDRQRNRFDLSLSQQLGKRGGALYANVSSRDYWNRRGIDTQFQFGYTNTFRWASYSISATRMRDAAGRNGNQYYASISIPLGNGLHAPNFSGSVTRDTRGSTLDQATLNGSAGIDNQFNYGITASHDNTGTGNAASINGGYRGSYAQLSASYGRGHGYTQSSLGAMGVVVAHAGGILFGQASGDTMAIIAAPDAAGARVANAAGVRINHAGYALVPYLDPYRNNTIELDPQGLSLNVQLDSTSARVAPYAGAVVEVKFKTSSARSLILRVRLENGDAVPFGAEVVDAQQRRLGVVGQGGRALLRGVRDAGQLTLRWQDAEGAHSCAFDYRLGAQGQGQAFGAYAQTNAICRPAATGTARTGSSP